MTSGTLSPYDVQVAFISKLKGDANLVAAVTAKEIKEANWGGDEFVYPAVRVDNNPMQFADNNGNCFGEWFDINVSVFVFTEGTSSRECSINMGLIGKLLGRNVISSAVLRSQPLSITYIPPIPDGMNKWRGEVVVLGTVKEL